MCWSAVFGCSGMLNAQAVCLLAALLLFSWGCAVHPSEEAVRGLVIEHFEGKGYRVEALVIGSIEGGSIGEKVYMSPRGYKAVIRVITLEVVDDVGPPWNYSKGQTFTFRNGVVRFRERQGMSSGWEVSGIEGITVR